MNEIETETCFIGLGSNLNYGDQAPFTILSSAIDSIQQHAEIQVKSCSSCYISRPHGSTHQQDFHNAVAEIDTLLSPKQLLIALHAIEFEHGLDRNIKQHWGPRTLDLDILLYGNKEIQSEHLTIPHPYLAKREFVLLPLYEISPNLSLPNGNKVQSLAENCPHNGIIKLKQHLPYHSLNINNYTRS